MQSVTRQEYMALERRVRRVEGALGPPPWQPLHSQVVEHVRRTVTYPAMSPMAGWTIEEGRLINDEGTIALESTDKIIWIQNKLFGHPGVQIQHQVTTSRIYIGDGEAQYFKFDGYNISWSGTNTSLTADGDFTASSATITGSITATTGEIGGWTITSTVLHKDNHITLDSANKKIWIADGTFGNAGIQLDYNSGTPRAFIGSATYYVKFDGTNLSWKGVNTQLTAAGAFTASNATITGTITTSNITATGGTIGGWSITSTTLSSANITLDDGNDQITVGGITLDGAVPDIESSTYVSGSAGFHIDEDFAEFGNVAVRGTIAAMVLKYQEVTAVGGSMVVARASRLTSDAASGQNTLYVEDPTQFSVSDTVRLSEGGTSESRTVQSIGGDYITVTVNLTYSWKAGAAVVKWMERILLTSELANSPYVSIVNASGTEKARLGCLDGLAGDPTGYGLWSDNVFLEGKIVATSGTIGGWTIGSTSIYKTGIWIDSDNLYICIKNTTFGSDGIQLDYNGGNPRVYIGDGVTNYFKFDGAYVTWSGVNTSLTSGGVFTASDAVLTGTLSAASGVISIDGDGIAVEITSSYQDVRSYQLVDSGGNLRTRLAGLEDASYNKGRLVVEPVTGKDSTLTIEVISDPAASSHDAVLYLYAYQENDVAKGIVISSLNDGVTRKVEVDLPTYITGTSSLFCAYGLVVGSTSATPASGCVRAGDGAVGAPSLGFYDDTNTGIYRIGSDNIGISCGNSKELDINGTRSWFSGDVKYTGGLISYKNTTEYTVYGMKYLASPLTSVSWDGDTKDAGDNGTIDLSSVFGVPAGVKAVLVRLGVKDATQDVHVALGPSSSYYSCCMLTTDGSGSYQHQNAIVPCDGSGDIYFWASGELTEVWVQIWGYAI